MGPRFESGLLHQDQGAVAQWVEQCFFTLCRRRFIGNLDNVQAPADGVLEQSARPPYYTEL